MTEKRTSRARSVVRQYPSTTAWLVLIFVIVMLDLMLNVVQH